ncbi:rhodanese-like domain-containing protein [Sphingobacteriales bacterium UPWRP_1]|nr:hypothetical protein BVG80_03375 [Sphingobacteriales bacterium TSM_CSM]PSJ75629.1 rhodanese-like domain-containing protein [Sphingobacteriales bacterium UPWRP_1]
MALGFLFSCNNSRAQVQNPAYRAMLKGLYKNTVPLIGVKQAQNTAGYLFLDAREWKEYEVSHIENALWIGYDHFSPDNLAGIPPDAPIVVYCSVGYRSERIGEQLLALGYTNVHNLYGGIFEWFNQQQPVVNNNNRPTLRIHAYSKTWGIWLANKAQGVRLTFYHPCCCCCLPGRPIIS